MSNILAVKIFFVLLFIQATLISVHHCTKADIIEACVNHPPCIETYANIYNALTSDDNSFNIESALYPATLPSSVRVFVNVYGPNRTDNSTTETKYTWSINCLYAAFPARVLEVLSLGSILVTPRTQELNITIPQFCCNVSVEKRQMMIKDVLAALQDLAVNPSIRDPRLNSAECVTKGHKPDIEATGRSAYRIRAILWSSFISVLILGPLLAFYALDFLKVVTQDGEDYCVCCKKNESNRESNQQLRERDESNRESNDELRERDESTQEQESTQVVYPRVYSSCSCCYKKEKPLILSVNLLCNFLFFSEIILVIYVVVTSNEFFMLVGMISEGFAICMIQRAICKMQPCTKCRDFCNESQQSSIYRRSVFVASTDVALYHLFWLIIGIMVNPTWGVTVLLVVCVVIVALFYAVFMICDVDHCCSSLFIRRLSIFAPGFLGLCLAAAVPVLAGQSFYGRETADNILKTALLYVINFLALWMYRNAPSTPNPAPAPPALAPLQVDEIELGPMDEEARRLLLQSTV